MSDNVEVDIGTISVVVNSVDSAFSLDTDGDVVQLIANRNQHIGG